MLVSTAFSGDFAITWTEQTSSGSRLWTSIASSSNGTKLIAGAYSDYIYTGIPDVVVVPEDITAPTLTAFTSTTPNGRYAPGATINIRAKFNENLGTGSTMTVMLDTGASVVLDTVVGKTLNGTYTVLAGQTSLDLTVTSITSASVSDRALNSVTSFSVPFAPKNIADVKKIRVN